MYQNLYRMCRVIVLLVKPFVLRRCDQRFGFREKLENVYVIKEQPTPETNSWVEIPEEGFKHTREKSSYSVTQEIPAYFTASSKLK